MNNNAGVSSYPEYLARKAAEAEAAEPAAKMVDKADDVEDKAVAKKATKRRRPAKADGDE